MPNSSVDILNETDDFQRRLDWVLFTNENENHGADSDWVPGDPLWSHPRMNPGTWDEVSQEHVGGGQVVRRMFDLFDEDYGLMTEGRGWSRCQEHDTDWRGPAPCFLCDPETAGPSVWEWDEAEPWFGSMVPDYAVADVHATRVLYGIDSARVRPIGRLDSVESGIDGVRGRFVFADEVVQFAPTEFSIRFVSAMDSFRNALVDTSAAMRRMWEAIVLPLEFTPSPIKPYRKPWNSRSPFQKLLLKGGKPFFTQLDEIRDWWDMEVDATDLWMRWDWERCTWHEESFELPEFDIADHYVSGWWEILGLPRHEPRYSPGWVETPITQQRRRRNV